VARDSLEILEHCGGGEDVKRGRRGERGFSAAHKMVVAGVACAPQKGWAALVF